MTGKVTEIRESLLSEHQRTATGVVIQGTYKMATLLLDFDDPRSGVIGYLAHSLTLPVEILGDSVKLGDTFTLYFEPKRS